jgi:hypothetical protein
MSLRGALRRGNLIMYPRRLLRRFAPRNDTESRIATTSSMSRNDRGGRFSAAGVAGTGAVLPILMEIRGSHGKGDVAERRINRCTKNILDFFFAF